jgi:nucleoside-diphosphate-sugar epimerase
MNTDLEGLRVLVTGATGFLGGRLSAVLKTKYRAKVTAVLNRYSTAARIARYDMEMIKADLSSLESTVSATKDCAYIVHCAYDWGNKPAFNIRAVKNLAKAAKTNGVKRLIHISTISVYRTPESGVWNEDTPKGPIEDSYGSNKLAVEKAFVQTCRRLGQNFVVLQPSIVYGPWGGWSLMPIHQLSTGRVGLPSGGTGVCNPVYVDDVAEAIVHAITEPKAVGGLFLISGPDTVSWRDYWGSYEKILGLQSTVPLSITEIMRLRNNLGKLHAVDKYLNSILPKPILQRCVRIAKDFVPPVALRTLKKVLTSELSQGLSNDNSAKEDSRRLILPEPHQLPLFTSTARIDISKAKDLLNFNPRYDFKTGMACVESWMKWANIYGPDR